MHRAKPNGPPDYFPPCHVLLRGLGIDRLSLEQESVTVLSRYLRFLISRLVAGVVIDELWYEKKNPDVRAAKLTGDITSYQEHFETHGYLEGRIPYEPPFDPSWYRRTYIDLAETCKTNESARDHFLRTGHEEGRAGIAQHLDEAERWRLGQ